MEWVVFLLIALAAAAYIVMPRNEDAEADEGALDELQRQRAVLLAELREMDEDAAAGRISADDRRIGRRALGPRLREVTEALRAHGEGTDSEEQASETSVREAS